MYHPTGKEKGGLQWQVTEDKVQDKAAVRTWEAAPAQVKAWEREEVEEEEWVEEDWGQPVIAFVHSAGNGHPTKEEFPVSNRNVQNVEFP